MQRLRDSVKLEREVRASGLKLQATAVVKKKCDGVNTIRKRQEQVNTHKIAAREMINSEGQEAIHNLGGGIIGRRLTFLRSPKRENKKNFTPKALVETLMSNGVDAVRTISTHNTRMPGNDNDVFTLGMHQKTRKKATIAIMSELTTIY